MIKPTQAVSAMDRLLSGCTFDPDTGCWLWNRYINANGRGSMKMGGKTYLVHRASYILHKGPIPDGLLVCHSCDVKHCVNPHHLWVGTQKDNIQDCVRKGRVANRNGERNPQSKLTQEEVLLIRELYPSMTGYALAEKFNVKPPTIYGILQNRRWKYLTHLDKPETT